MRSAESDCPLGDDDFARLIAPAATASCIALAVSGGADSLALLHLAARWRDRRRSAPDLVVLTVDHRLRPGSAAEARAVAEVAAAHGLAHELLVWDGARPATGIEAAARAARYRLLLEAARRIGASHLVVAHHREDQAETFLLRLARGSGVYGLGAMRPAVDAGGVTILRPFLTIARSRLAATVRAAGLKPADDETNRDARFARARLRRLMPRMAGEGLGTEELAAAAVRLARAGDALDQLTGRLIATAVTVDDAALVRVDWPRVAAEPDEIRLRLLARLIVALGGAPVRSARLESLLGGLESGHDPVRTLGGVVLSRSGDGVLAWRESGRAGLPVIVPGRRFAGVWDGRFRLDLAAADPAGLRIAALGEAVRQAAGVPATGFRRKALRAAPGLFREDELLAAPVLGLAAGPGISFRADCIVAAGLARPRRFPDFGQADGGAIHHTE